MRSPKELVDLPEAARKAGERLDRLQTCALFRMWWAELPPLGRRAIEVAELYADGGASLESLNEAYLAGDDPPPHYSFAAAGPTSGLGGLRPNASDVIQMMERQVRLCLRPLHDLRAYVRAPQSVLTQTVVALAWAANDERLLPSGLLDPQRLAVLSDALEEAGCPGYPVLAHLRDPVPHVRGCWVIDLFTGRV